MSKKANMNTYAYIAQFLLTLFAIAVEKEFENEYMIHALIIAFSFILLGRVVVQNIKERESNVVSSLKTKSFFIILTHFFLAVIFTVVLYFALHLLPGQSVMISFAAMTISCFAQIILLNNNKKVSIEEK